MIVNFSIKHIVLFLLVALSMLGCSNDLDLIYPAPPFPVIYCQVDPCDSFCYVTLSKSFIAEDDVSSLLTSNSQIGINNAEITLEAWGGGYKLWETGFSYSESSNQPTETNSTSRTCYRSDKTLLFVDPSIASPMQFWNYEYFRLQVKAPEFDQISYSRIPVISGPKVIHPLSGMDFNLYGDDDSYLKIQLDLEEAKYADLICRFHFRELSNHWEERCAQFIVKKDITLIDRNLIIRLFVESFFNILVASINEKPDVAVRVFNYIDFTLSFSDEYFYDYYNTYLNVSDHCIQIYTNITNGLGIFTMKREVTIPDILFDRRTLDSLCYGRFTKHLNFRDW